MLLKVVLNTIDQTKPYILKDVSDKDKPRGHHFCGETIYKTDRLYIVSQLCHNRISGVMVSMLASNTLYHGFKPRLGQTKDYKIGICCFSANHAALRRKSKDWLGQNQANVSEWNDKSIHRLLLQ